MTQIQALKSYFKRRKTLTQREAMTDLGIMRLSERIRELERTGYQFVHGRVPVASRYGSTTITRYRLVKAA